MKKFFLLVSLVLAASQLGAQTKAEMERNDSAIAIYTRPDPLEKEKVYIAWIKKYPPEKFKHSLKFYDYVRAEISKSFALADKPGKAIEYANKIANQPWNIDGLSVVADLFISKQQLEEAVQLLRKLRDITPKSDYAFGLAKILVIQKKYKEAFPFAKEAYDSAKVYDPQIHITYGRVLEALDKNAEGFQIIEDVILRSDHSDVMFALLKELFQGNEKHKSWEEYESQLKKKLHQMKLEEMAGQIISRPAPEFSLPGIGGSQVSLSSLRGKIVILDFWATWCGPCIRSFPFMQQLVNKFDGNDKVGFYFIHTWEREPDATKKATDFVRENKYNFNVLMDLKDSATQVNKVSLAYQVPYVPHKLIIDQKGVIRFIHVPTKGTEADHMEDLEAVIELLSEPKFQ